MAKLVVESDKFDIGQDGLIASTKASKSKLLSPLKDFIDLALTGIAEEYPDEESDDPPAICVCTDEYGV